MVNGSAQSPLRADDQGFDRVGAGGRGLSPTLDRQIAARSASTLCSIGTARRAPEPAAHVAETYADMTVNLLTRTPRLAQVPPRKTA